MHVIDEHHLDDDLIERRFVSGDIPGIAWIPDPCPEPVPTILLGHPGGLNSMYTRLLGRARMSARHGFATATIELPGSGDREPLPAIDEVRTELRQNLMSGQPVTDDIVDRLVLPLVDIAVPEWQVALDDLMSTPELRGPIGFSGGVTAIGLRLAGVEPRIAALVLFAGSFVPHSFVEEAARLSVPMHMLLQWDDERNDRQAALNLFDAYGSHQKTLSANMGGHTGVPDFAGEEVARFLARHLH
ncbi:dienelactone hydrolase family protein [Williamsia sterculiae]|uniref:Dienelactone hydrolase n=1 Tax=Williamsia sterculiae TaxID=1344003 RepID=A0A1N7CND1_9NOCA|nr:alpha/beta hydrolase [Williamsia sterculiae]SIR65035.1 hypothetical protein SAMN05445060_0247 [Williamsia sterculiae]